MIGFIRIGKRSTLLDAEVGGLIHSDVALRVEFSSTTSCFLSCFGRAACVCVVIAVDGGLLEISPCSRGTTVSGGPVMDSVGMSSQKNLTAALTGFCCKVVVCGGGGFCFKACCTLLTLIGPIVLGSFSIFPKTAGCPGLVESLLEHVE